MRRDEIRDLVDSLAPGQRIATISGLPSEDEPIESLVANRRRTFARKAKALKARKLIPVRVDLPGPIGIHWFGDPHVDDDGCNWPRLEADMALIRNTPGMLAASIGDQHNNWPGRLGRLYGKQETAARTAWRLVDHFISTVGDRWLAIIGGNHDLYSGDGDPQRWMADHAHVLYKPWVCRMGLRFPNGRTLTIQARHQWRGYSMWNHAHALMRAGQRGHMDHVLIGGHTHVSGYGIVVAPIDGRLTHCVQVASYKTVDEYADEISADPASISCSATLIIDPDAREENALVHVVFNPEEAADYLTWKRDRWAARK